MFIRNHRVECLWEVGAGCRYVTMCCASINGRTKNKKTDLKWERAFVLFDTDSPRKANFGFYVYAFFIFEKISY